MASTLFVSYGDVLTSQRVGRNTLQDEMRFGNILMIVGAAILVVGALVKFAPGLFAWFGNLPGDIRIEGENTRLFIPITSMILISVVLTVVVNLFGSMFRDR
jgi:hypothetical protein